ncbi:hypothetical protein [Rhodococcus sp. LB1]|uniref:hypothetical protein n=1 Tax=Rhodococcus sp. LB1 TaxID=1807499 RepID=UPI00077A8B9B|nr:hypothetical protein [Rhodococcus sp. LB1]KXX55869.1 hypothetical protein AZG88_02205 [Rhodococcus sp. LB1]
MTLKRNANEALRALETDPSAEIADVDSEVLSECPVAKVQGPFLLNSQGQRRTYPVLSVKKDVDENAGSLGGGWR